MVGSEVKENKKQEEVKRSGQTSWENERVDLMKHTVVHRFRPSLAGEKIKDGGARMMDRDANLNCK